MQNPLGETRGPLAFSATWRVKHQDSPKQMENAVGEIRRLPACYSTCRTKMKNCRKQKRKCHPENRRQVGRAKSAFRAINIRTRALFWSSRLPKPSAGDMPPPSPRETGPRRVGLILFCSPRLPPEPHSLPLVKGGQVWAKPSEFTSGLLG